MTAAVRRPPIANWLLTRFVSGPMRESLIGDIDEQFGRGRSSSWYWRQVLVAILFGLKGDFHERPFAVISSVILTVAATIVWVEFTSSFYALLMDRWVDAWVNSSRTFLVFEFWVPFGGGTCLVWCVGAALSSRVTARLTDSNRAVLMGIFFAQVTLSLWLMRDSWLYGAYTTAVSPRLWVPNFLWAAVVLIGMPISTILGAFWAADRSSPRIAGNNER